MDLDNKNYKKHYMTHQEGKIWKQLKRHALALSLALIINNSIDRFENAWNEIYISFDIPFSNKCHVLIEHIHQAIQRTGKSLYSSSAQVVEALRAKFDIFWSRYNVLDLERESHGEQLLKCVIDFNSKNN